MCRQVVLSTNADVGPGFEIERIADRNLTGLRIVELAAGSPARYAGVTRAAVYPMGCYVYGLSGVTRAAVYTTGCYVYGLSGVTRAAVYTTGCYVYGLSGVLCVWAGYDQSQAAHYQTAHLGRTVTISSSTTLSSAGVRCLGVWLTGTHLKLHCAQLSADMPYQCPTYSACLYTLTAHEVVGKGRYAF